MDNCPGDSIFFYDYICYYRCPNKTLPNDFVCKESFDKNDVDSESCSIKNYFLNVCKKNFSNPLEKKLFIEQTVNEMLDGKLYDLALMSI